MPTSIISTRTQMLLSLIHSRSAAKSYAPGTQLGALSRAEFSQSDGGVWFGGLRQDAAQTGIANFLQRNCGSIIIDILGP